MITFNNDWDTKLALELQKKYFTELLRFLEERRQTTTVYPEKTAVFNALRYTAYADTKVCILGQDPYYRQGQAHGLAFSVQPTTKVPPSLKNIFKELQADLNLPIPQNGYLKNWADEGVLLLNTVLTVEEGKPGAHKNIGWQRFTDHIIQTLNQRETPLVFILWGNAAIDKQKLITNKAHLVLSAPHPSPLSAYRGFFGSAPFSKVNRFLENQSISPIQWKL